MSASHVPVDGGSADDAGTDAIDAVHLARTGSQLRLPLPWQHARTDHGRVFFINDLTRSTQWDFPVEAGSAALDVGHPPPSYDASLDVVQRMLKHSVSNRAPPPPENSSDERATRLNFVLLAMGIVQSFLSCMLVVFVPQLCPGPSPADPMHSCTIWDQINWSQLSSLRKVR